jgi:hypothetical protein
MVANGGFTSAKSAYYMELGSASFSWSGSTSYPTIYSSNADRWVMICYPHVPYLRNGVNGHTGNTSGSAMVFASDASTTTYWGIGVNPNNTGGDDSFSISRASSRLFYIDSSGHANVTGNNYVNGIVFANNGVSSNYFKDYGDEFVFRTGSGTGATRHINLANTTGDPSNAYGSGISWGQRTDGENYYLIHTTQEDYNGNYSKLTLNWHTGIRIGAASTYGGTRFYNNSTNIGSEIASIGKGDNNMRSNYDVIAYASDKRLKTNVEPITNAIDKIKSLQGMTYNWNEVGDNYGWEAPKEREAGVFAQDVQAVLPEAVRLAPFDHSSDENGNSISKSGENFLTVKYEKLVPLLIEAVKELSNKVEELENKLNGSTRRIK